MYSNLDEGISLGGAVVLLGAIYIYGLFYTWYDIYKKGRQEYKTYQLILLASTTAYITYDIGLIIFSYGTINYLLNNVAWVVGLIHLVLLYLFKKLFIQEKHEIDKGIPIKNKELEFDGTEKNHYAVKNDDLEWEYGIDSTSERSRNN